MSITAQILSSLAITVGVLLAFYAGYRAGMTDGQTSAEIEAEERTKAADERAQAAEQRAARYFQEASDAEAKARRGEFAFRLVVEQDHDTLSQAAETLGLASDTFAGLRAHDKANTARLLAMNLERIRQRKASPHPDTIRMDFLERAHTGRDFEDLAIYVPVGEEFDSARTLREVIDHAKARVADQERAA